MFEYHGWATLHTDIVDEYGDEDQEERRRLVSDLRAYIEPLLAHGSMHIEVCNGLYALNMFGHNNHRNESVVDVFKWLSEKTRGSYGLLYIHDDEDFKRGNDYTNHFRVWKLALGQLTELDDPFLSPRIPTVELPS
ncbi:MAG: Imm7 family immunity protein [Leptolyngbya sp. BL-A-14]